MVLTIRLIVSHLTCFIAGLVCLSHQRLFAFSCHAIVSQESSLAMSNSLRRELSETRAALYDETSLSHQHLEAMRVLETKANWAKGNRTVLEKKLREVYGEQSLCAMRLLNLSTSLQLLSRAQPQS